MKTYKKLLWYPIIGVLSLLANIMIKIIPFKKLIMIITNSDSAEIIQEQKDYSETLDIIYRGLEATKRRVFWRVLCYEQAIVALIIAHVKKIPLSVDFGVKTHEGKIVAHAWTRCGERVVTGGDTKEGFVSVFRRVYRP